MMQTVDGPRRRQRRAARLDAAGRPDPLRPPGLADGRGPHPPAYGRQRPHRRLPHGCLGRRVPRLPRRRPAGRQGGRPGAARRPRAAGDRRRGQGPGAGQGEVVRRLRADHADRPAGRPLHRADRAGAGDPGGPGRQGGRQRGAGHHQARPRRPAGQGDGQRGGDLQAAQGRRRRGRGRRHRAAEEDRREGRRDGPRHRLHQDHAGAPSDTVPTGTSPRPPTTATPAASPWSPRETPSPAARRHHPGAGARPRRPRARPPRRPTARSVPTAAPPTPPDALFCEACGYDFTTGSMPRTGTPAAADGHDRPRPADGNIVAAARRHAGWPSSGSTRSGTASSPAPTRSRPPARPSVVPLRNTSLLVGRASEVARHPPRHRLRHRQRRQPPARPADHRRHPLVGRGPRLLQRHLRRRGRRRRSPRPRSRSA